MECTVDLDSVDFGYRVGEIEVLVEDEKDVPRALEVIAEYAERCDLELETTGSEGTGAPRRIRSKLLEYLIAKEPETLAKLKSLFPSQRI